MVSCELVNMAKMQWHGLLFTLRFNHGRRVLFCHPRPQLSTKLQLLNSLWPHVVQKPGDLQSCSYCFISTERFGTSLRSHDLNWIPGGYSIFHDTTLRFQALSRDPLAETLSRLTRYSITVHYGFSLGNTCWHTPPV